MLPVLQVLQVLPVLPVVCAGAAALALCLPNMAGARALRPEGRRQVVDHLPDRAAVHARGRCGPRPPVSWYGKSSDLYTPEAGAILLDGLPISELQPEWFHRQVG